MKIRSKGNYSFRTWQDAYYDNDIGLEDGFCECTQRIIYSDREAQYIEEELCEYIMFTGNEEDQ